MTKKIVTVFEGGGSGIRAADVCCGHISDVRWPKNPITNVDNLLAFVAQHTNSKAVAVGYSMAGSIEDHCFVQKSPNLPWLDGTNLGKLTKQVTRRPTYVANDAEASVTGAHILFPDLNYFMLIIWSSGIGGGIWREKVGVLSRFEGGHMCLDYSDSAPTCACGMQGCVEAFCGGKNVQTKITEKLRDLNIDIPLTEKEIGGLLDAHYINGEAWAKEIYGQVTLGMGRFIANLISTLNPPAIIFKGAFALTALGLPEIEKTIRAEIRKKLLVPSWEKETRFLRIPGPPRIIKDGDSFLGAAKLALNLI